LSVSRCNRDGSAGSWHGSCRIGAGRLGTQGLVAGVSGCDQVDDGERPAVLHKAPRDACFAVTPAGSEVRPRPRPLTLRPHHTRTKPRKQGRKHYPHPPCRLEAGGHPADPASGFRTVYPLLQRPGRRDLRIVVVLLRSRDRLPGCGGVLKFSYPDRQARMFCGTRSLSGDGKTLPLL